MSQNFINSVNAKKIYIASTTNNDELKEQKSEYCRMYNSNEIEDLKDNYNTYLFIILLCRNNQILNKLKSILEQIKFKI